MAYLYNSIVGTQRKKLSGRCRGNRWIGRVVSIVTGLTLLVSIHSVSHAQGGVSLDPTGRSGEAPFPQFEERPAVPAPEQILPPLPPAPEGKRGQLPLARVFVRDFDIIGSTVFSEKELGAITAPYKNRELTAEDLEDLRRALTLHYVNQGYVNSGAIIPDQEVLDGVIVFRIIEGELTDIQIEGTRWFRPNYIKDRVLLGADSPLNVISLQKQLRLMHLDPRIQRINAELKPGIRHGESSLTLLVKEEVPYNVWMRFNNYQSPTVGAERGQVIAEHRNVTGNGDTMTLEYGRSEGIKPQIDMRYSLPLTPRDTTFIVEYRKNDFSVVEEPFEALDVESESEIFGITLRHPLYKSISQEFALSLTGEYLHNETSLLDEPFSFSLGAHHGKSTVTAVRFSQEWTLQSAIQVIAVRSRFSLGVDAFGSTINDSALPDSRFFAWLGQLQVARRLKFRDIQLILRSDIQLTNDPLLSLEQIAVGGRYSVRGYRENQMVRDNGFISSLEIRIPVARDEPWAESLSVATFIDYGRAWNKDISTPDPKNITSIGLGLRWSVALPPPLRLKPQLELYWGYPLRDIHVSRWDLQDEGFHIQLVVAAF